MVKATEVVIEEPACSRSHAGEGAGGSTDAGPTAHVRAPKRADTGRDGEKRKNRPKKATPLPMRQLVPMTFVLLNESLCGTMLLPFIGYLIAFLQGWSADDAGYFSGVMVGIFAFGQIVSARVWGNLSDKYGRRFPLISGLFTSGIMMLGFGLSSNVWYCAFFRFLHGLFNGNILVAKTMMADITDKTNQAKGFAFVSFCSGIGFLIGPLMGGILYNPAAADSALSFLHLSPDGIFARRPALLPSLFIFLYTNVGVTVCTFFVQESNPNAQPLPNLLKLLYPCMWVTVKPFVATPMAPEEEDDEKDGVEDDSKAAGKGARMVDKTQSDSSDSQPDGGQAPVGGTSARAAGEEGHCDDEDGDGDHSHPLHQESATFPVGVLGLRSPLALEDTRRFDRLMEERLAAQSASADLSRRSSRVSCDGSASVRSRSSSRRGVRQVTEEHVGSTAVSFHGAGADEDAGRALDSLGAQPPPLPRKAGGAVAGRANPIRVPDTSTMATRWDGAGEESPQGRPGAPLDGTDRGGPLERGPGDGIRVGDGGADGTTRKESFGYRQAFSRPITRFMLVTYMILCASDLTVKLCFPLWAISSTEKGGLASTPVQVSYALLFNSFPTLVSNYFFSLACNRYANKIALFRLGATCSGIAAAMLPMSSYLPVQFLQYAFVVLCVCAQQFFCSWCYGLITMLTARAAPPGKIGVLMGINQSCGALSRAIVPLLTGPLYAWSISGKHPFPINHVFVFYLAGLSFSYCWFRSYSVRTINGTDLVLVEGEERYGPMPLRKAVVGARNMCGCATDQEPAEVTIDHARV